MRKIAASLSLLALVCISACGKRKFSLPSNDMEPTIPQGSSLVADMKIYNSESPKRFDLVVFHPPVEGAKMMEGKNSTNTFYCKRVIGLPNEKIEIRNIGIYINSKPIDIPDHLSYTVKGPKTSFQLNEGEYFLLGDNSINSLDSRYWGPVHESMILGKIVKIQPAGGINSVPLRSTP